MSTPEIFARIRQEFLQPAKLRKHVPQGNSKGRLRHAKGPKLSERAPTIFNWRPASVIWRTSEQFNHKSKHRQQPHVRNWRMPVTILGGEEGRASPVMPFTWMKLRVADIKSIEKAGGLEAKMISTAGKNFSVNGKMLRNALFHELHRMNDAMLASRPQPESEPESGTMQVGAAEKKANDLVSGKGSRERQPLSLPKSRKRLGIEAPKAAESRA